MVSHRPYRALSLMSAGRRASTHVPTAAFIVFFLLSLWLAVTAHATDPDPAAAGVRKAYRIAPGPLDAVLNRFGREAGVLISFSPALTAGLQSAGVQGTLTITEALGALLSGTGLGVTGNAADGFVVRQSGEPRGGANRQDSVMAGRSANPGALPDLVAPTVTVTGRRAHEIGPIPGLALTREQIPGNVQTISAEEIKQAHSVSLADLMNSHLQSVNVNDYQGNPFQMDVTYRGFTASPQIGTPQGLSVFFDGIRVNEPFGDVVNWDMVPMNALSSFDVFPGSNPIFGLNTLGGALVMRTKNGFEDPGLEAEVLAGSFGRRQLQVSNGWNNGTVGLFGAGNFFMEDGWRVNSPSKVNQAFGKASFRSEKVDLNFSTLVAWTDLVGNGLIPSEMYEQNRRGVFTSPDTTQNKLVQFQLSGSYFVNDNFSVSAQAYRRNSKRHAVGADVYTEFEGQSVRRNLNAGEEFTCLFETTNQYNLPDYYVVSIPGGNPLDPDLFTPGSPTFNPDVYNFLTSPTLADAFATLPAGSLNPNLPDSLVALAQNDILREKNFNQQALFAAGGRFHPQILPPPSTPYSNGNPEFNYVADVSLSSIKDGDPVSVYVGATLNFYYYTPDNLPGDGIPTLHLLLIKPPTNGDVCYGDVSSSNPDNLQVPGPQGGYQTVDGAAYGASGPGTEGVVEGTPTAVFTDNQIDQLTDGASIQFNWNFTKHKFMIGASIDRPSATYRSGQMLGMLDADRNAYLAPHEIRDQYAAASTEISNNNFGGDQVTKSVYASETWSPIETLHITGAARYNDTHGQNTIASRTHGSFVWDLAQLQAFPDYFDVCRPGENCPTGYVIPDASKLLYPSETEKFSYYSLNPSLGVSWQAKPNFNLYTNWAQGTRTPSVIELGCALDKTLVANGTNPDGSIKYIEKSLAENRSCSLPSTLSGDPYLPQIRAQTIDLGMRGSWGDSFGWNLGAYQTDLKDDIYLITFPGNRSFFDTVGKTRRRGIEAGISGAFGRTSFRVNYALTDATFQDSFMMASNDNSSSVEDVATTGLYGRRIQVSPGDRMPGVPLHNLNATLGYAITPKWQIGLTGIAHSESFVRGNENNKHRPGVVIYETMEGPSGGNIQVPRRATTNPGTVPGYVVFNFQTSYRFSPGWTLGLLVSNIFNKEYFTAGRLGRNPFSPSVQGAIGPDGYNHNSSDWFSTNFIAPGAPRGAWLSLSYEFGTD